MSYIFMSNKFVQSASGFLRNSILLFVTLLGCYIGSAQTINQLTKAGDQKVLEGDYFAAAQYFKDALRKDEQNLDVTYKYAEACRQFNDLDGANYGYRAVLKLDKQNQYPMTSFWLGEILRSSCICKCEEAQKQFHRFESKYRKKEDYYYLKAQQEIEACNWAKDHALPNESIKIEHLGKEINTPQSEFNAIHVYPDKLQYSALRNISTDKKKEKYLVRIYNSLPNYAPIYMPMDVNPELNIGNGVYSPDAKKFFFTQCEQLDKTNTRCDIYVTQFDNFKWTPAEKLNADINPANATNTQPNVGYDLAGNEVLFFASNRAGGQGGMDIYSTQLKPDGTYTSAVNAGATVNTIGNEITPFYDINAKKLFFSSDWHYGFGGYDIFETKGESTNWIAPKNVLQPINTPQNDMYYSMATDNSKAYITSNRKGSYFIEAETCCNDIYAYNTGKKVTLKIEPPVTPAPDTTIVAIVEKPTLKFEVVPLKVVLDKLTKPETPTITPEPEPVKVFNEQIKRIKQIIPVQLYFDNDEPNAKSMSDTTTLDYKQTYEAYSALKSTYEVAYAKPLKQEDKAVAQKQIQDLFTTQVDKGFYNLIAFSSQLTSLLQAGNTVEITIKGFCSPLNFNAYNIKLGYRRVASLRNYFFHYREALLMPYINSGKLILKTESLGEETSSQTISDNRLDTRNSVYNPSAALERRVEIISVEIK